MKKILLISFLVICSVIAFSHTAYATDSSLSTSPSTLNATVGVPFDISIQLNPADSKVCVVMGTINFNGLSCQNITIASGLMGQTVPTCASPNFIVGIPKCTDVSQNLFSISVKGSQQGQSTLSFTGIKVIGAGSNVSSIWQGGAYNIVALKTITPIATEKDKNSVETQEVQTSVDQTALVKNIPTGVGAEAGAASLVNSGAAALADSGKSPWFIWILMISTVLIIIYAIYYFVTRKKKQI
jgi:hypothetical protein